MYKTKCRRISSGFVTLMTFLIGVNALLLSPHAAAQAKDSRGDLIDVVVKDPRSTSQVTIWRVTQPDISQAQTTYPQITFMPGDKFKVLAGGCDQTGGHGRTWKRYVNPQGDNTDRLYHGLIFVAHAEPATRTDPSTGNSLWVRMSRLSDFGVGDGLGKGDPVEHSIPDPLPKGVNPNEAIPLVLGFEDDGYSDNGYWGRDPGNNDQCVNVPPSYVEITIGHHGAIPPDPALYVGIRPADFRCQAGWQFYNQGTPELSYASFQTAFQITWAGKYLNPFNEILFLALRGNLAKPGNCEGMDLLALAGEDQFVVGDIKESFWHNYQYGNFLSAPANVQFDINVAHWQQVSGYFLHNWIDSVESDAPTVVSHIEHDLNDPLNYNYGLLSIAKGFGGHVLVPLKVTHSGEHTYIDVYNPNIPCVTVGEMPVLAKVDIVGNKWSYDMGGSDGVWSGENGALGLAKSGMGYIPYHGPDDGWTDQVTSLSGLSELIFGGDVNVEQVTDSKGRKLLTDGKIDTSDQGLGRSVVKLLNYGVADAKPKRPRSGDKNKVLKVTKIPPGTAAQLAVLKQFDQDYARDYENSGLVYVVADESLTDLKFTLSSKTPGKPIRALINKGGSFIEVKSLGASAGSPIHPSLTLHNARDLSNGGVTLASGNSEALKVTFTHGVYDDKGKTETLQRSSELAIKTSAKAKLAGSDLQLMTGESPAAATVDKQTIGANARIVRAPLRKLNTAAIQ